MAETEKINLKHEKTHKFSSRDSFFILNKYAV